MANPNRIEREKFVFPVELITSAPARVTYFPPMNVAGPVAYCAKAWVMSYPVLWQVAPEAVWPLARLQGSPLFGPVGYDAMTSASLPRVRLTRPPKPSFGCAANVIPT